MVSDRARATCHRCLLCASTEASARHVFSVTCFCPASLCAHRVAGKSPCPFALRLAITFTAAWCSIKAASPHALTFRELPADWPGGRPFGHHSLHPSCCDYRRPQQNGGPHRCVSSPFPRHLSHPSPFPSSSMGSNSSSQAVPLPRIPEPELSKSATTYNCASIFGLSSG